MTLQEFKAWFDGFTENMGGEPPTGKQWDRIKERVKEIDGVAVSQRVFIDHYWRYPYPWPYYSTCGSSSSATATYNTNNSLSSGSYLASARSFNSSDAMLALGRAEARA